MNTLNRASDVGQYARLSDGAAVYVYGYEDGRYQTVRMDRDEECTHLGCELTPWTPAPGERVVEANNEDCISGTVVETGAGTSLVNWLGFNEPQVWRNAKLEPFCS
jgi:hypothetical protein